jgi:uncharacterized protein YutE (UPF0331/DUF86 family)
VNVPTLDPLKVRRHLSGLLTALAQLRKHTGRPVSVLDTDLDELWAVERGLQLACQNALDVAAHVAATSGHPAPSYAAAIDSLIALGVVDEPLGTRFREIAGLRNVLVFRHLAVDTEKLHDVLNHHLDDFAQFASLMRRYLAAAQG